MVKKIVCIFLIALFLINSSLLTVVSTAVDDINSLVEENINNAANINATQNISKDNNKKEFVKKKNYVRFNKIRITKYKKNYIRKRK